MKEFLLDVRFWLIDVQIFICGIIIVNEVIVNLVFEVLIGIEFLVFLDNMVLIIDFFENNVCFFLINSIGNYVLVDNLGISFCII